MPGIGTSYRFLVLWNILVLTPTDCRPAIGLQSSERTIIFNILIFSFNGKGMSKSKRIKAFFLLDTKSKV